LDVFGVPEDLRRAIQARRADLAQLSPYLRSIHDKHVIGVNTAYRLGPWIDITFFGDDGWFRYHRVALSLHPSLKVTCAEVFAHWSSPNQERIKFMGRDYDHPHGISAKPGHVSWGHNSGAAAISLAYHLDAKRIFLLGFDMDLDENGNPNWHGHHAEMVEDPKVPPFDRHGGTFVQMAEDAAELGLEILNVNPNSQIDAFPRISLEDALAHSAQDNGAQDNGAQRTGHRAQRTPPTRTKGTDPKDVGKEERGTE
jgi:hypothetical protein